MDIPNNLRIGSKPTKELIDEGVPANSKLVGVTFYFETGSAIIENNILADGYKFEFFKIEKDNDVCAWMR